MRAFFVLFILLIISVLSILGFRGSKSTEPPIVVFPDMDSQSKYLAQGENAFFADKRVQRPVVPGTVVRGYDWEREAVFSADYQKTVYPEKTTGKTQAGEWVSGFPVEVTYDLLTTGREKYTLFCAVCHGASGDGNGITKTYGMVATPSYHNQRLRDMAEGELFNTITQGKGQMLPYRDKLNPHERWAVIAYLRALQRTQNATLDEVPLEHRTKLDQ